MSAGMSIVIVRWVVFVYVWAVVPRNAFMPQS